MITITSVTIRGYRSFGDIPTTVNFHQPGLILLTGQNRDRGVSSGAGKSSLMKAICTALFEENDDASIKRWGENTMLRTGYDICVEFTLSRTGRHYQVEYQYNKGKTTWHVYCLDNTGRRVDLREERQKDTGAVIAQLLQMTYTQFVGQAYMSQDRISDFIFRTQKERIEVFSNILRIAHIDTWIATARERKRRLEQMTQQYTGRVHALQQQLTDENARYVDGQSYIATGTRRLHALEEQIARIQQQIDVYDRSTALVDQYQRIVAEHAALSAELTTAQHEVQPLHQQYQDISAARDTAAAACTAEEEARLRVQRIAHQLSERERQLTVFEAMTGTCEYCGQALSRETITKRIDEYRQELQELRTQYDTAQHEAAQCADIARQWSAYVQAQETQYMHYAARMQEIQQMTQRVNMLAKQIADTQYELQQRHINPETFRRMYTDAYEEQQTCVKELFDVKSRIQYYTDGIERIRRIETAIREYSELLTRNEQQIAQLTAVEAALGDRGFRNWKISSCVDFFNSVLNSSLNILTNGECSARLTSQVATADKKSTKFFLDILVSDRGKIDVPIRQYSGGERALLSLAIIRALWELSSASEGVNILLLDEPFAHMDRWQMERACNLLEDMKQSGRAIIVITNDESVREVGNFDREIRVIKENHISRIEEYDLSDDH